MPDRRHHRGPHPDDVTLFAPATHADLCRAASDYCWLLTHRYAPEASLKLVGDHFQLTKRQRLALMRVACSDHALWRRRQTEQTGAVLGGAVLALDGFNVLITLEAALSGGLILVGRDGCYRDLASVHGTYRRVDETKVAVQLVIEHLVRHGPARVTWYLDSPVSNSGRLKALIEQMLAEQTDVDPDGWRVELVHNPDRNLAEGDAIVVSSDSTVLDRCDRWLNLGRQIVDAVLPATWILDLFPADDSAHGPAAPSGS